MNKKILIIIIILLISTHVVQANDGIFAISSVSQSVSKQRQRILDTDLSKAEQQRKEIIEMSFSLIRPNSKPIEPPVKRSLETHRQEIYEAEMNNPPLDPDYHDNKKVIEARKKNKKKKHEFEIGFEQYHYKYEEKIGGEKFMDISGNKRSIYFDYIFRTDGDKFIDTVKIEGQYAGWDDIDYDGGDISGFSKFVIPSTNDRSFDVRFLPGKEYVIAKKYWLTPYLGIGYRRLDNNIGSFQHGILQYGTTKRSSRYIYIPVGLSGETVIGDNWSLGAEVEYDYLVTGKQYSSLSGLVDLENVQHDGFGLRSSVKVWKDFNKYSLSIEPFIRFWKLDDSEISTAPISGGGSFVGYEPQNETTETGLKIGLNF